MRNNQANDRLALVTYQRRPFPEPLSEKSGCSEYAVWNGSLFSVTDPVIYSRSSY
jgi:hypothetical protein